MVSKKYLYPEISGHISTRNTEYYHMVINAGCLPDGKRNRMSASTGLPVKGNQRKTTTMLNDTIHAMLTLRKATGILPLKELYSKIQAYGIENLEQLVKTPEVLLEVPSEQANGDSPLFSEVIDEWLAYHKTRVKGNTYEKYKYATKHVKAYFENERVSDVTPRQIAKYYTYMQEGKTEQGGKPLKASTLADHQSVLNMSLTYAKRILKVIRDNPAEEIRPPKKQYQSPDFFREDELNKVFALVAGEVIAPAIVLAGAFGLRRQEAVGMKWSAIDLDNDSVTIQHTVTKIGSGEVEADTAKSKSSFRTLILLPDFKPYFLSLKEYQKAYCTMCGRTFSEDSYICIWPNGERVRAEHVSDAWGKFLEKHNIRYIRYHDLRHSSASLLLRSGLSLIEVKEWLGHADIKTTERYAHLGGQERQQRVAEKISGKLRMPISI